MPVPTPGEENEMSRYTLRASTDSGRVVREWTDLHYDDYAQRWSRLIADLESGPRTSIAVVRGYTEDGRLHVEYKLRYVQCRLHHPRGGRA